jgi:transcriptional regulator with XRE-family HTH domain
MTRRQIADALGLGQWEVATPLHGATARHEGLRTQAKDELRERARDLRAQGWYYGQIATELGVAKSTLSMWLRDLPYPAFDQVGHCARMREAQRPAWDRIDAERTATRSGATSEIGEVSDRELWLLGVALYWAEGAKSKPYRRRECVVFTNSDPVMLRLFCRWLTLLGLPQDRWRLQVHIHETSDADAAARFWATTRLVRVSGRVMLGV